MFQYYIIMNNFFEELEMFDSEVYAACNDELTRQQHNIELIASENIVSKAVLLAAGTVLTDLPYKKRPVPMYPFEEISEDDISEAKSFR